MHLQPFLFQKQKPRHVKNSLEENNLTTNNIVEDSIDFHDTSNLPYKKQRFFNFIKKES